MSGGGQPVPQAYTPTGSAQADSSFQNLTSGVQPYASALPGQVVPQLTTTTQNVLNNPYTAGYTGGAQASGAYQTNVAAPQQQAASSQLYGLGDMAASYAPQLLQQAFDPQRDIYNQGYAKNLDSTNAILAMNGVAGSPYAAGVTGQSVRDYNNNYNQQQLSRELSGLQGLGSIAGTAGGADAAGSSLGADAANSLYAGGQQPYSAYGQVQQDDYTALMNLISGTSGAVAPSENLASTMASYLGIGQGAAQVNQNAQKLQDSESSSLWSGLGKFLGQNIGSAAKAVGAVA